MIKGDVSVEVTFFNGTKETIPLGSNMIMDNVGHQIVQALTTPPGISSIPSASSILDTSNYTIQAITFGKPQSSFSQHAHAATSSVVLTAIGFVGVFSDSSSYNTSSHTGKPQPPAPNDQRLENNSTTVSGSSDLGHNLNGLLEGNLAAGCYPLSAGTSAALLDANSNILASGSYTGRLNTLGQIDASGFVNMTVTSTDEGFSKISNNDQGLIMTSGVKNSDRHTIEYRVDLSGGDFLLPNLYGGIYSVGLWGLDIKSLLQSGITPPYAFSSLNNPRKYKLFAKKIFVKDLTFGAISGSDSLMNLYDDTGSVESLKFIWGIRFV